jgi:prepilin-type N-terminal cleavage/methylation domain-containing protein
MKISTAGNRKGSVMKRARGFTLVEIMIVVVLLGVLAAIVIPSVGKSTTMARETTLAMDLNLLRRFIPVYTSQHLEIPPGYPGGNLSATPTEQDFIDQATLSSNDHGQTAARGTPGFPLGPYISNMPVNPFNKLDTVEILADGADFPAVADDSHGWICKPATGEIRADNSGTDTTGKAYYAY